MCALITACTSAWSTICRNHPLECRCFANAATLCLIKNATCTRVQQTRVAAQMRASHICASPGADVHESRRRCADLLIERPAVHAVAVPCGEVHERQCELRRQQRVGRHDELGRQQVRLAPAEACRHIAHLRLQLLLHADGSAEKSQRATNPRRHAAPRASSTHTVRGAPTVRPVPVQMCASLGADVGESRCRCARDLGFLQALPLGRQHVGEDVRHLVRRDAPCLGRRCSAAQQWALRRAIAAVASAETIQRFARCGRLIGPPSASCG